jgi:hypothetical protein
MTNTVDSIYELIYSLGDETEIFQVIEELIKNLGKKHKNNDPLWDLILIFPNKDWDWDAIAINPNTTLKYIELMITKGHNWNWKSISGNPNLTIDFLNKHVGEDWDWNAVSANQGIEMRDIIFGSDKLWNPRGISRNPNVTIEFIKEHPEIDFDKSELFKNPNLTLEDIIHTFHYLNYPERIKELSKNVNVSMDIIMAHPEIPWLYKFLSYNTGIIPNFFSEINSEGYEINNPCDWSVIVQMNPFITPEFLISNSIVCDNFSLKDIPYSSPSYLIPEIITTRSICDFPKEFSSNPACMKYIDVNIGWWDWERISSNPGLKIEVVKKYKNYFLDKHWKEISRNQGIKMEDITNNPNLPWNWEYISLNPNLLPNFVIEHLQKPWNWNNISKNKFGDNLIRWYEYPDFVDNQRGALNDNFYSGITEIILGYVKNERVIRSKIQDDDTFISFPGNDFLELRKHSEIFSYATEDSYERDDKSEEQILVDTMENYHGSHTYCRIEDTKILGSVSNEYMTFMEIYGNSSDEGNLLLKRGGEQQ